MEQSTDPENETAWPPRLEANGTLSFRFLEPGHALNAYLGGHNQDPQLILLSPEEIIGIRDNNQRVWDTTITRLYPTLVELAAIHPKVGCENAEDVVQLVLEKLYRIRERLDPTLNAGTYILRILGRTMAEFSNINDRNLEQDSYEMAVAKGLAMTALFGRTVVDPATAVLENSLWAATMSDGAMDRLSPVQKQIVTLLVREGLNLKEAAARLDIPAYICRRHLERARRKLSGWLKEGTP